jgi:molybdopterin biosynthesis enzyme
MTVSGVVFSPGKATGAWRVGGTPVFILYCFLLDKSKI